MLIKKLIVYCEGNVLRDIDFKSGLNIITNTGDDGNQIGKSTVLRAINFCLGSDGKSLWLDPENKSKENPEVKRFLLEKNVVFELVLEGRNTHNLKRSFYEAPRGRGFVVKTQNWINGVEVSSQEAYKALIANDVFGYSQLTPSFNSVKKKFLRIERATSNNSYRFLHQSTSNDDYTLIYSTIFGFSGLNYLKKISDLKSELADKESKRKAILDGVDISSLHDELQKIDLEINHLRMVESEFKFSHVQERTLEILNDARRAVAHISTQVANMEMRAIYNQKTIDKYNENVMEFDVKALQRIYEEAVELVPHVNKTFEEVLSFHNRVFSDRARQSIQRKSVIEFEISALKSDLNNAIENEQAIIKELASSNHLDGFISIEKEIQTLSEAKGRIGFVLDEAKSLAKNSASIKSDIQQLKVKVENLTQTLDENLNIFNSFFVDLTRRLFKKHANFLNVTTDDAGNLKFGIVNTEKNTGDGSPRAESMAFDIAMVAYAKRTTDKLPHFTLQDYLESVDEDKLQILFDYAGEHKLQVIISILNDKLTTFNTDFIQKHGVLFLSQSNKFFKLA
ncbi:DUF2326 domain-containing protein [Enterobacter mori]|uniref:DUF2326 domain-containing protein n=1 Tax=Enterobacter mori TaxID=539813 RepID=UPI001BFC37A9|nr:DUF2326 domain-containing protein [Enterobacter mori]QWC65222.1 DUF2326 domain-containing protein [Enterobacter mori]